MVTIFGRKLFFALATVALVVVGIRGGVVKGRKGIRKINSCNTHYFILWNPFYVMLQGRFGLGYILCLADDITLGIIYIKKQGVGEVVAKPQPTVPEGENFEKE